MLIAEAMAAAAENSDGAVDTKILGEPGKFDDAEDNFAEWSFVTRGICGLVATTST